MEQVSPESVGFLSSKLDLIEPMCKKYIDKGQIAGVSAIITKNNKVVYRKNIGFANIEKKIPIKDDTIYRIYSMSKPITVVGIMMLFQEGLFNLDDPIKKYIEEFNNPHVFVSYAHGKLKTKKALSDITIKQLLTMTSGISYGWGDTGLDKYYNDQLEKIEKGTTLPTLETFVKKIATFPLTFEPGSDYLYSFSIDVIGHLIEVLSGKKYSEFIKQRILDPLKMDDTFLIVPDDKKNRLASLYQWEEDKLIDTNGIKLLFEMPGAGYHSTIGNYQRFCQMLLNKGSYKGIQLLKEETINLMSKNHLTGKAYNTQFNDFKKGYGYGLGVRTLIDKDKADLDGSIGEWGWDGMASTWMCIDPKEQLTAVFMIQLIPYNCFPAQKRFQQLMYGALER